MWQKPSKTRSQSEGLFRAAAFEKSCPVEPTLQDFPGEGVGLGKRQDGDWVQEGEQVLHQLRSHPEQFLCLSVGRGAPKLSFYEALNFKLCLSAQRQSNAEHCVVIHSEKMVYFLLLLNNISKDWNSERNTNVKNERNESRIGE